MGVCEKTQALQGKTRECLEKRGSVWTNAGCVCDVKLGTKRTELIAVAEFINIITMSGFGLYFGLGQPGGYSFYNGGGYGYNNGPGGWYNPGGYYGSNWGNYHHHHHPGNYGNYGNNYNRYHHRY